MGGKTKTCRSSNHFLEDQLLPHGLGNQAGVLECPQLASKNRSVNPTQTLYWCFEKAIAQQQQHEMVDQVTKSHHADQFWSCFLSLRRGCYQYSSQLNTVYCILISRIFMDVFLLQNKNKEIVFIPCYFDVVLHVCLLFLATLLFCRCL